jgi:hypothetical protein
MRATILILILLISTQSSWAQSWDDLPKVPPGVVYKPLSAKEMETAAHRIRTILAPDYKGKESLVGSLVVCGPGLWPNWANLNLPSNVESIPATFNPGGEGRLFKAKSPILALDKDIRATLAKDGGFELRRPTSEELSRFWGIIDFDIVEPLIMIESSKRVLLYYSTDGKMVWIDQYR